MDFRDVIRKRRSIRGYQPTPVPGDILSRVLEAARLAPTTTNRQSVHLIAVSEFEIRLRLCAAYSREWFYTAPVILVGCVEPARAWQRQDGFNAAEVDLAITFDHVILAATAEGLGTCWVCAFDEAVVKEVLGIPAEVRDVAKTPRGYPDADPAPLSRKPTRNGTGIDGEEKRPARRAAGGAALHLLIAASAPRGWRRC
jgi:nitroreductase